MCIENKACCAYLCRFSDRHSTVYATCGRSCGLTSRHVGHWLVDIFVREAIPVELSKSYAIDTLSPWDIVLVALGIVCKHARCRQIVRLAAYIVDYSWSFGNTFFSVSGYIYDVLLSIVLHVR